MALFKALWNRFYLPLLNFSKQSHRLRIFLLVLNSIFIPCIATAFTSPACFQVWKKMIFISFSPFVLGAHSETRRYCQHLLLCRLWSISGPWRKFSMSHPTKSASRCSSIYSFLYLQLSLWLHSVVVLFTDLFLSISPSNPHHTFGFISLESIPSFPKTSSSSSVYSPWIIVAKSLGSKGWTWLDKPRTK